jgi:hypothetical protein
MHASRKLTIDPAPKLDPSVVPPFTAKQGQYLAFIHNYTKIHRRPPAESDLQYYFRVSPSCDTRYDQDPGAQRAHRKKPWAGPLHSPPRRSGVPAAIEVVRSLKPTTEGGFGRLAVKRFSLSTVRGCETALS